MRRLLLNAPLAAIVGLGALALSRPVAANEMMECEDWELVCKNGTCCTVCPDGEILDCEKVE